MSAKSKKRIPGVRIPVGTPIQKAAQAAGITGDKPQNGLFPDFLSGGQEYPNYSRAVEKSDGGGEKVGEAPLFFSGALHTREVPLRSKPVQITRFTDKKSGKLVFHVPLARIMLDDHEIIDCLEQSAIG